MTEDLGLARSKKDIWLMAIRPKTLILSVAPILLAALLASHHSVPVNWLVLPVILMSAISIQIATNLWNDAIDASSGLDDAKERLGPPRVTSLGLMTAQQVRQATYVFLGLAAVCGVLLVMIGGWPIFMIGIVGILCAFSYSSGPYPISGSPFGELLVIAFFGVMSVMGSYYLMTGLWSFASFWAGFYIGLPAAAVLTVNNHRDREGDARGGRRTLAIQLGPEKTKQLYAALLLLSCLGLVHLSSWMHHGTLSMIGLVVAILLALFAVLVPIRRLFVTGPGAGLNLCLALTAQFQFIWLIAYTVIHLFS